MMVSNDRYLDTFTRIDNKKIDFEIIFFRQQKVNVCSLQQNDIILPLTHVCHNNNYVCTRINDIAIAMSYSSRADPGLRVAFKCLNV